MLSRLAIAAAVVLALMAARELIAGFWQTSTNFTTYHASSQERSDVDCGGGITVRSETLHTDLAGALRAWYVPPTKAATIVLLHGTGASGTSLAADFCMYASAGFGVFTYDSPGYGDSRGHIGWGEGERRAFKSIVGWIRSQSGQREVRIGAVGYSAGGFVLACAAAQDSSIDPVVLAGAPGNIYEQFERESGAPRSIKAIGALLALAVFHDASGGDPQAEDCVSRLSPRALLILGGQNDRVVDPGVAKYLYRQAAEPKDLWIVPGAGHLNYLSAAGDEYRQRMISFFEDRFLSASVHSTKAEYRALSK